MMEAFLWHGYFCLKRWMLRSSERALLAQSQEEALQGIPVFTHTGFVAVISLHIPLQVFSGRHTAHTMRGVCSSGGPSRTGSPLCFHISASPAPLLQSQGLGIASSAVACVMRTESPWLLPAPSLVVLESQPGGHWWSCRQ